MNGKIISLVALVTLILLSGCSTIIGNTEWVDGVEYKKFKVECEGEDITGVCLGEKEFCESKGLFESYLSSFESKTVSLYPEGPCICHYTCSVEDEPSRYKPVPLGGGIQKQFNELDCERLDDVSLKNSCFTDLARKTNNVAYCDRLDSKGYENQSDYSSKVNNCKYNIIIWKVSNSPNPTKEMCDSITNFQKSSCLEIVQYVQEKNAS